MKFYKHIPNCFTLFNLFFGCIAIVFFLKMDEGIFYINAFDRIVVHYPQEMWYGSLCIGMAAVVDFLDGFLARWLKANSELGKQLDSLSDVVSFGVAPSVLLYQLLFMSFGSLENMQHVSIWWLSISFILAMSGAYRLGRFNTMTSKTYFIGLPIPAVGIFVASLVPIIWTNYWGLTPYILHPLSLYSIIFVFSFLMNSNIKFFSLKKISLKNVKVLIALSAFILLAFLVPILVIPISILTFIFVSILFQSQIQ